MESTLTNVKLIFILTKFYPFCRALFNILSDLQEFAQFQSDVKKLNLNRIFKILLQEVAFYTDI